jgi:hypothetical protein
MSDLKVSTLARTLYPLVYRTLCIVLWALARPAGATRTIEGSIGSRLEAGGV